MVCEIAVICAIATSILDVGWKKTRNDRHAVIGLRFDVLDVVDGRGQAALEGVSMRFAISSGEMPL